MRNLQGHSPGWTPLLDPSPSAAPELRKLDIRAILERATAFQTELALVKERLNPADFQWYPYSSWANMVHLDALLTSPHRFLLDLAGGEPILDIGCADGDLAFFLESLGCTVQAIDWPATNYNALRGIKALKAEINSSVDVYPVNLDSQFTLPHHTYGLVFFLGVLYHLKNPFYVLETLARHARWCLLSTRIARFDPARQTQLERLPVAYLLGEAEANNDPTNYWVFSDAGLRRVLDRAGWKICDYQTIGNTVDSDPVRSEGDERAFCLLQSRLAHYGAGVQLLKGWHELEQGSWRWTERCFSALIKTPAAERVTLHLAFRILPGPLAALGPLTLGASVNGAVLPAETYSAPGDHTYIRNIPRSALGAPNIQVEFQIDKALAPSDADRRELGLIVSSLDLE